MLLRFVTFHVKQINFNGRSKRLAVILNFWISQGTVAMQLRSDRSLYHRYIDSFLGNLPVKHFWKLVAICRRTSWSKVKCLGFWDTVYLTHLYIMCRCI